MAAPPPALMDELVEEILIRIPPDEPACLARAAVVCKRWCRLVTDPGFQRRFRQLHRTPPLLGFIVRCSSGATGFLPTSSFRPPDADCREWFPLDSQHGRILFYSYCDWSIKVLVVWTPATGGVRKLPMLWHHRNPSSWTAALLCGAPGCDHMECPSGGPFNVILVAERMSGQFICAYVCSSEDDEWSKTAAIELPNFLGYSSNFSSALVRNALCFLQDDNGVILEYNLVKKQLSVIRLPPICNESTSIVLMTVGDDGLGFAMVNDDFSLCIWLRVSAPTPSGGWTWTQHRVVDIKGFLPVSALSSSPYIVAAVDAVSIFVIWAGDAGFLAIDLKSKKVKKVSTGNDVVNTIPFVSFCTPALGATSIAEEPSTGASTNNA